MSVTAGAGQGDGGVWDVQHRHGSAGELHALDLLDPATLRRGIWVLEADAAAVVLGSAQRPLVGRPAPGAVVRRSGGGAVLVDPGRCVWVDVVIPRHDPLWHDDVSRSGLWLGRCWQRALADVGIAGEVHEGAADRDALARAACFAGVGPGEVIADGRKLVGISQRRTRAGARWQCLVYTDQPDAVVVAAALGDAAPAGLVEALERATGYVTVRPPVLVDALVRAMMTVSEAVTPRSR